VNKEVKRCARVNGSRRHGVAEQRVEAMLVVNNPSGTTAHAWVNGSRRFGVAEQRGEAMRARVYGPRRFGVASPVVLL